MMSALDGDSSPEPDSSHLRVSEGARTTLQRDSIISLGSENRAGRLAQPRGSLTTARTELLEAEGNDGQYAITDLTEGGFILSTKDYDSDGDEDLSVAKDQEERYGSPRDEGWSQYLSADHVSPRSSIESSQAITPFRKGSAQDGSTLMPADDLQGRRDSNVLVTPAVSPGLSHDDMSHSSSDESLGNFERDGHQGSYVLRKGSRRSSARPNGRGDPGTLNSNEMDLLQRRVSVAVTPIQTLDRSQPGFAGFSSSSEESLVDLFNRDKGHRSLVLKRGKRRKSPIPEGTVFTNPAAVEPAITVTPLHAPAPVDEDVDHESDSEQGLQVLHKDVRKRVQRSLAGINFDDFESKPSRDRCSIPCLKDNGVGEPSVPPELKNMQRLGFKMAPKFFFPALPKVLQDIWVGIELFITLFELLFACVTFGSGGVVNILVVILSLINLILASIDGFLYFVEGGSCVTCFRWGRKQLRKRRSGGVKSKGTSNETEDGTEKEKPSSCSFLPERARTMIMTGSEVIRIGLTELLLYPLTVLDIFETIDSQTYEIDDSTNQINFGLLNIGLFYLVLTVYIIRIVMSISGIVSISRLPKTTNSNYHNLLKKFFVHLIGQIFVHMTILVMVATKLDSERCVQVEVDDSGISGSGISGSVGSGSGGSGSGGSGSMGSDSVGSGGNETVSVNVSPFLYVTIFTGDVIPFLGVAMFFVVNYPALKQFSMGFCIDMISTVVSEDFASTVLTGEGIKQVKRKASKVTSKVNLALTRTQFSLYKNAFSFKRKFAYRLTNPLVVTLCCVYFAMISLFLICHALGWSDPCNSSGSVRFISFNDHSGTFITFIMGVVAITIVNYQVVAISVMWLLAFIGVVVLIASLPVTVVLITPFLIVIALTVYST